MTDTPISVVGRLTADPELRYTSTGQAVANFTVASNTRRWDQQTREWADGETSYFRCAAWRELAENVAESLRRGDEAMVVGKIQTRSWETRTGERRSDLEVKADHVGPSLRARACPPRGTSRGGEHASGASDELF